MIPPAPTISTNLARGQEVVRYRGTDQRREQSSFFSLLFERPARRRYYHQLNRNATNLVRRLSQSRLFLNSSRSQNANYRNSFVNTRSTSRTEEEPGLNRQTSNAAMTPYPSVALTDESPSHIGTLSVSLPSLDHENRTGARPTDNLLASSEESDGYTSEPELFARAETPPPAYKDILPTRNDT